MHLGKFKIIYTYCNVLRVTRGPLIPMRDMGTNVITPYNSHVYLRDQIIGSYYTGPHI